MLTALMVFLIGCLVLSVVIYVVKLVADMLTLPEPIKKIGLLILGLLGFIILIMLAVGVFNGGGIKGWLN